MLIVKHAKAKATRKVRIHRCRRTKESKFSIGMLRCHFAPVALQRHPSLDLYSP